VLSIIIHTARRQQNGSCGRCELANTITVITAYGVERGALHRPYRPQHSEIATPKFDNRKKSIFFKTIIDFLEKNEINIPKINITSNRRPVSGPTGN